jgi:hypothetical protein
VSYKLIEETDDVYHIMSIKPLFHLQSPILIFFAVLVRVDVSQEGHLKNSPELSLEKPLASMTMELGVRGAF